MKMPISEDEYDHRIHSTIPHQTQSGLSKAEQRRSNKPIMEKRRRARINHCLNELKALILDAMKKDPARHSKLEKADILEMTVKHLQTIQRQQLSASIAADPSVLHKFKTGFNECAGEVGRYIGQMEGVDSSVKQRLVSHLTTCVTGLQQMTPFSFPATSSSIFTAAFNNNNIISSNNNNNNNNGGTLQQTTPSITEDVNNNHASARLQMMTGLQLIPSRLPTGELALLLPNSQQLGSCVLPFFTAAAQENNAGLVSTTSSSVGNNLIDHSHHTSAFTAVNRKQYVSPLLSPASSIASSYNDESTSDQPYPSPSEVTSTSEHQSTKIKFPKNEKHFTITATSINETTKQTKNLLQPQSALGTVNLRFESVKKKEPLATNLSLVNSIQTPLKVITTDQFLKIPETSSSTSNYLSSHRAVEENSQDSLYKNPLDFSMSNKEQHSHFLTGVKRSLYSENNTDRLLMKSSDALCYDLKKIPRLSSETEDKMTSSKASEDKRAKSNDEECSNSRPSTSTAEVTKDMWRPW